MSANGHPFSSLQEFLKQNIVRLGDSERWRHYPSRKHRENVLQHTVEAVWLGVVVIDLELRFGKHSFNPFAVLSALAVHDIGEGLIGDMPWYVMHDPRVEKGLQEIECEQFRKILEELPADIRSAIEPYYNLQRDHENVEGRLFEAIEKLGYVAWAVREYTEENPEPAIEVFARQHQPLLKLAEDFKGVRTIYDLYRPFVEEALASHPDLVQRATQV